MPDYFEFRKDNPYIVKRLTQGEINGVQRWQSSKTAYQFSFHTQHEAGWPCYLSEPNGPNRNLPKINLKVPTNPPVVLQGESVKDKDVGADFRDVIRANVALFQKLAKSYYEPEEQVQVVRSTWVVSFDCNKGGSSVVVKLPLRAQIIPQAFWANFKRFAKTPVCPVHKSSFCLQGELKELKGNDAVKVKKLYDDNGEVQEIA